MIKSLARAYLYLRRQFQRIDGKALELVISQPGQMLQFEGYGRIHSPKNLSLGTHIFIGRNFFFQAKGGISIGDYCHISRNVTIQSSNHAYQSSLLPYDRSTVLKPVRIGKFVWIGMNASILPGVTIGDGAVIGLGAVITKDVPAGAVVVGNGRIVAQRDPEVTQAQVDGGRFLEIRK